MLKQTGLIFLVALGLLLTAESGLAHSEAECRNNRGPDRIRCRDWSYGGFGDVRCQQGYSPATRWCYWEVYNFDTADWEEIDSSLERGCGSGVTGGRRNSCPICRELGCKPGLRVPTTSGSLPCV